LHQFGEAAVLLVLIEEGQPVLVESLEPVVPGDALERVGAAEAGIVDAQDAEVAAARPGAADVGREPAARFDPLADLVAIGGGDGGAAGGFRGGLGARL
jgi:hypothetical protein